MTLIFVYNANSGKANAFVDCLHKFVSPKTYSCNLCAITFNTFSEKKVWKEFRQQSIVEMHFLHKDEFQKEYASKWLQKYQFPVVLIRLNGSLEVFISSEELNKITTSEALINLINSRLTLY